MASGRSLHIGINRVDPLHYQGWSGPLTACEADARDMQVIADRQGCAATLLLTAEAIAANVVVEIEQAARSLDPGDLFVLSYSGHGGQVRDTNGDEVDERDETWVLFDRQLVDDELFGLWSTFAQGVRILVFSDSCHSGSAVRGAFYDSSPANDDLGTAFKAMPRDVEERTYKANEALYDSIQVGNPHGEMAGIGASVLLISGCQDNQYSRDGERNGLFTQRLREVWGDGAFNGTYRSFHRAIADLMPPDQSPNFLRVGALNPAFETQVPFTV